MSPTGYTSALYDGKEQTFEEFVMACARAFGALVSMRDEPVGAAIPEAFEPSAYHVKEIDQARQDIADIKAWGNREARMLAASEYDRSVRDYREAEERDEALRERYDAMLDRVNAWQPPTPDHQELKDFMVQQLARATQFDCGVLPHEPVRQTGEEYRASRLAKAEARLKYHVAEHAKETERAQERTRWVRQLRESLVGPEVAPSAKHQEEDGR